MSLEAGSVSHLPIASTVTSGMGSGREPACAAHCGCGYLVARYPFEVAVVAEEQQICCCLCACGNVLYSSKNQLEFVHTGNGTHWGTALLKVPGVVLYEASMETSHPACARQAGGSRAICASVLCQTQLRHGAVSLQLDCSSLAVSVPSHRLSRLCVPPGIYAWASSAPPDPWPFFRID